MFKQLTHIIFSCLIVLILYIFYVSNFVNEEKSLFNVVDRNITKFEAYHLSKIVYKNLIVGSSMAANIKSEYLNDEFYNLASEGGNCFSGLQFIKQDDRAVERIFLEINSLYRNEKSDPSAIVLDPYKSALLKTADAFREQNKPVHNIVHELKAAKEYINSLRNKTANNVSQSSAQQNMSNEKEQALRQKLFEMHHSFYQKKEDSIEIIKRIDSCFNLCSQLQEQGKEIVLMELPVDQRLNVSPLATMIRSYVIKKNEKAGFKFLHINLQKEYRTHDFVHLNEEEMAIYTLKLVQLGKAK